MKIDLHLLKIWPKISVVVFLETSCIWKSWVYHVGFFHHTAAVVDSATIQVVDDVKHWTSFTAINFALPHWRMLFSVCQFCQSSLTYWYVVWSIHIHTVVPTSVQFYIAIWRVSQKFLASYIRWTEKNVAVHLWS